MKQTTVDKLNSELIRGVESEAQVVYLLASIRKILERDNSPSDFEYLKFHCDWALHATLTGKFAQKIIASFDLIHADLLINKKSALSFEASRISGMDDFHREITSFFRSYSIMDLTRSNDEWARFLYHYARVIESCSLKITAKNPAKVNEVTISVQTNDEILKGHRFFKVSWNIKDVNGNTGEVFVLHSFENNI